MTARWLVTVLAAAVLAACQTTDSKYTPWEPLTAEESGVQFVGPDSPTVTKRQMRWIYHHVRAEQILLETDSAAYPSELRISNAGTYFNEKASRDFSDPERVRQSAVERCLNARIGKPVVTENVNGPFIYVTCRAPNGNLCVRARQGFPKMVKEVPDPYFSDVVDFLYCSVTESEAQMLRRFASIRLKDWTP